MRIQEAAEKSGLSCHTLRYYEKQGLIYPIPRDTSGHRLYRERDIRWLYFVQCLKSTKMPLKDIRAYAMRLNGSDHQAEYLLHILTQHKTRLKQQKANIDECLEHVDWKINHYTELL
jgi:DNA-binding transcriptional MerR regulator